MANEPNIPSHPFYQSKHNRPNPRLSETQYFIDPTLIPGNTIPPLVPDYTPNVVNNNGTARLLAVAGQIAPSVQVELSIWFRFNAPLALGVEQAFMQMVDATNQIRLRRRSDDAMDSRFEDRSTDLMYGGFEAVPLVEDTLYHLYIHGGADLGPELVQNGTGLVDTSFWIPKNAILAAVGGNLEVSDNGQFSVGYQGVPTEVGATYLHTFTTKVGSTATQVGYGNGSNPPADNEYANNEQPRDITPVYPTTYQYLFTASSSLTYLSAGPDTPNTLLIGEHSLKKVLGDVDDYGGVSLLNGEPFMADGVFDPQDGLFGLQGAIGLLANQVSGNRMDAIVFDWYFNSKQIRGYDAFQHNGNPIDISAYTDADILLTGDAAEWNASNNEGSIILNSGGGFTDVVPMVPDAFVVDDWELDNTGGSTGELFIDLLDIPGSAGTPVTDTLYSLDGGPLLSMGLITPGRFTVRNLQPGELYVVRLYSENSVGLSAVSDIKELEAAVGNRVPHAFDIADWTLANRATNGEAVVEVLSLPDDGGQSSSDIEYQVDSTGWVSSGLSIPGTFIITGMTNDVAADVILRAVNSIGNGDVGSSKTVTPTDPGGSYFPNIVDNNGVGWLEHTGGQIANSPTFELSYWYRANNPPAANEVHYMKNGGANDIRLRGNNTGNMSVRIDHSGDANIFSIVTPDFPWQQGVLTHVYMSLDISVGAGTFVFLVNGVDQSANPVLNVGTRLVKLDTLTGILSAINGGDLINAQVFDFYMDSNLIRGYDAFQESGDPIDISAFVAADVLITGDAAAWNAGTNEGTVNVTNGAGGFSNVLVDAVPDAFQPSQWGLTNVGDGDALRITVISLPADHGNAITDIEYELDDSGTWVTTGLSAPGQFQLTGLTTDVQVSVRIRAINSIGASNDSSAKVDIPTVVVPSGAELILIGTLNIAGEGSYNSIYTAPWTDGTYPLGAGEVVVAGGVGIFNGLQTAGDYVCDNRTVRVGANLWGAANQTEFRRWRDAVSNKRGFICAIRKDAVNMTGLSGGNFQRRFLGCIIQGDQPPVEWEDTAYTFANDNWDNGADCTFINISMRSFTIKADVAFGDNANMGFVDCHFGDNDPPTAPALTVNPGPNFTNPLTIASTSSGTPGFWFEGNSVRGAGDGDNALIHFKRYLMAIGNHCSKMFNDGWKIRGDDNPQSWGIIGGNVWTEVFSDPDGGAHCDSFQIQNLTNMPGLRYEASMHGSGTVAEGPCSTPDYYDGPANQKFETIGAGVSMLGLNLIRAGGSNGSELHYCGFVPHPAWKGTPGTIGDTMGRIHYGNNGLLTNTWSTSVADGSPVEINNLLIDWTEAQFDANLPNWEVLAVRPTLKECLAAFETAPAGLVDGMGPWHAVELTGDAGERLATYRDYNIFSAVTPNPITSAPSASSDGVTLVGSLTTDTPKGFVKWAVIDAAFSGEVSVADWKQLCVERLNDYSYKPDGSHGYNGNAIAYYQSVDEFAGVHSLNVALALVPGNYELLAIHIKGHTKRSVLSKTPFTVV